MYTHTHTHTHTHTPVCHSEGPGEINRREVVLDPQVTGSRRDQEQEVVLDNEVNPEEIMSREVELG